MNRPKVIQINTELHKVTGIQRVILDIHEALREDFHASVAGMRPYDCVNPALHIPREDYIRLRSPLRLRDSVVIIHERRLLPLMWMLSRIPGLGVRCVYVHHNELYGQKALSLFPDHVVAISDRGIANLTEYFGVPREHITKIHNCVREPEGLAPRGYASDADSVTILYPARINSTKRQTEIVAALRGRLDPRVRILFAGDGPDLETLREVCGDSRQFIPLGFRDDVIPLMQSADYTMLFSEHEGLPISLIEACMTATPIICNPIGGNTEIAEQGRNALLADDWDSLLRLLNSLPDISAETRADMGREGREIYASRFNFRQFRRRYVQLIKSIAK